MIHSRGNHRGGGGGCSGGAMVRWCGGYYGSTSRRFHEIAQNSTKSCKNSTKSRPRLCPWSAHHRPPASTPCLVLYSPWIESKDKTSNNGGNGRWGEIGARCEWNRSKRTSKCFYFVSLSPIPTSLDVFCLRPFFVRRRLCPCVVDVLLLLFHAFGRNHGSHHPDCIIFIVVVVVVVVVVTLFVLCIHSTREREIPVGGIVAANAVETKQRRSAYHKKIPAMRCRRGGRS